LIEPGQHRSGCRFQALSEFADRALREAMVADIARSLQLAGKSTQAQCPEIPCYAEERVGLATDRIETRLVAETANSGDALRRGGLHRRPIAAGRIRSAGVNGYPTPEEMFEDMRSCRTEVLGLPSLPLIAVLNRQSAAVALDRRLKIGMTGTRECWSTFRRPS
jgi:hypothetical protein